MVDDYRNYLNPQILAKLQGLELRARHIVEGFMSGLHRSPFHGFSVEFAEHREYVPGDDIRHVDWKLFARTDKYYLKQFEDETNLINYLLLDVSESMQFRSEQAAMSKVEYGKCIAAALAWIVLHQNDAVGLATFDDAVRSLVQPASGASYLKQLVHVLETAVSKNKTNVGTVLHDLSERLQRRGIVVVISDLFDQVSLLLTGLKYLRQRRHDVIVLHLVDPAEITFPFQQTISFHGLEQYPDTSVDARAMRRAYLDEFNHFLRQVKAGCHAQQIDYHLIRTNEPFDVALSSLLTARKSRGI